MIQRPKMFFIIATTFSVTLIAIMKFTTALSMVLTLMMNIAITDILTNINTNGEHKYNNMLKGTNTKDQYNYNNIILTNTKTNNYTNNNNNSNNNSYTTFEDCTYKSNSEHHILKITLRKIDQRSVLVL